MRKHSVAILKRIHAPFALTYVVTWRVSPQKTYGHLFCKRINLNSKTRRHTFSTQPQTLDATTFARKNEIKKALKT